MNFLMRSPTNVYSERTPIPEPRVDTHHRSASAGSSLESLKSDEPRARYDSKVDHDINGLNSKHHDLPVLVDKHLDVAEDEGWIIIPCSMSPLFTLASQFFLILSLCNWIFRIWTRLFCCMLMT